ncbi:MAG: hypothetical protein JF599_12755 [Verrucomicrobia bacterium]|nr:hypothetical protein [Verrucomicrobiota bacterium]
MKTILLGLISFFCFALAGCDTVGTDFGTGVREKFTGPVYRTQIETADARTTYEAARKAIAAMEFHFVRGGAAQGRIEALSGLSATDSLNGARQLAMTIKLTPVAGGTEVAVLITEQVQDDFNKGPAGQAIETPLRDTPLYDVFFRNVSQALSAK